MTPPQNNLEASLLGLIGNIKKELEDLEAIKERVEETELRYQKEPIDYYATIIMAYLIQDFYTGAERIFKRIAKDYDKRLPTGSSWHKELLDNMVSDIPEARPAVIASSTYDLLEDYRGFRHVVFHGYAHHLKKDRVITLFQDVDQTYKSFLEDIKKFIEFLQEMTKGGG